MHGLTLHAYLFNYTIEPTGLDNNVCLFKSTLFAIRVELIAQLIDRRAKVKEFRRLEANLLLCFS